MRATIPPVLLRLLYWLVVLVISLVLVIGLILFLESRDASDLETREGRVPTSLANTTIR